jgi:hypothetical protein
VTDKEKGGHAAEGTCGCCSPHDLFSHSYAQQTNRDNKHPDGEEEEATTNKTVQLCDWIDIGLQEVAWKLDYQEYISLRGHSILRHVGCNANRVCVWEIYFFKYCFTAMIWPP